MRLAFLGSPEPAVVALNVLVSAGHDVVVVITQPDRKRGRGGALSPSPVKAAAVERGLPVAHAVDDLLGSGAELGVVVAFGKLIKPHVLEQLPMVNLHFSLLPRWRGAAPVERAILAGDTSTGVCLMQLDEGLDTGPVYACKTVDIGPDETAAELTGRLADLGARLLVDSLERGLGDPVPQTGEPTYAAKLDASVFELRWDQPADVLSRVVRIGRAWTTFRSKRLRVLRAVAEPSGPAPATLDGLVVGAGAGTGLRLLEVQQEGKPAMPADAWARGAQPRPGESIGS